MSTETSVSTVAMHLLKVPENPMNGILMAAIATGADQTAAILKNNITSMSAVMLKAFDYAKTEYTLALPSGVVTNVSAPTKEVVADAIKIDISYTLGVLVTTYKYGVYEPWYEILDFLYTERLLYFDSAIVYKFPGLKFSNGQALKIIGSSVSADGTAIYLNYEYWGYVPHTKLRNNGEEHSQATLFTELIWEKISTHTETVLRPDTTNTIFKDEVIVATYQKLNGVGELLPEVYTWIYKFGSSLYPTLRPTSDTSADEYFPVIPIRYNNKDLTGQDSEILQNEITKVIEDIAIAQINYDDALLSDGGYAWVNYDGQVIDISSYTFTPGEDANIGTVSQPNAEWSMTVMRMAGSPYATSYIALQTLTQLQRKKQELEARVPGAAAGDTNLRNTPLYQTSATLLKLLNIDIDNLGRTLNLNPSIADIDHAYVIFGADVQSDNPATLAYLNSYFDYLRTLSTTEYAVGAASFDWRDTNRPSVYNSVFTEHGLNLSIGFKDIKTELIPGIIGNGQIGNARKTITYTDYPSYRVGQNDDHRGGTTIPAHTETFLVLDLQVTPKVIRRVTVYNLAVTNFIHGGYSITTGLKAVKTNPNEHGLVIPLEHNRASLLSMSQQSDLYTDCCLLIINSVQIVKLKWYQEEWFRIVTTVVIFVIAVWTMQPELIGLIEAAEVGLQALILKLTVVALKYAAMSIAFRFIVNQLGDSFGFIGAIVAAAVAIYFMGDPEAFVKLGEFTLMYAQMALQCAQALLSATNEFIQNSAERIIENYNTFSTALKSAYDAMDTNAELKALELRPDFDPLVFTRPKRYYSIPNEYPSEFFRRTLGLADSTYYGIHGAVPNFAQNLLRIDKNTVMAMA